MDHKKRALEIFLKEYLKDNENTKYSFLFLTENHANYGKYDCLAKQSKKDGSIMKNIIFFATICKTDYEIPMVEKQVIDELNKFTNETVPTRIYLIMFTPAKTITFDIQKLGEENKLTVVDNIIYLDVADAKRFEFAYNPIIIEEVTENIQAFPPEDNNEDSNVNPVIIMSLDVNPMVEPVENVNDIPANLYVVTKNEIDPPIVNPTDTPAIDGQEDNSTHDEENDAENINNISGGQNEIKSPTESEFKDEGIEEENVISFEGYSFTSYRDFIFLPKKIQWEYVYDIYINKNLSFEEKIEMLSKFKTRKELYFHLQEENRTKFLGSYGYKQDTSEIIGYKYRKHS